MNRCSHGNDSNFCPERHSQSHIIDQNKLFKQFEEIEREGFIRGLEKALKILEKDEDGDIDLNKFRVKEELKKAKEEK